MANEPGGPRGDYVSQTEYARERSKQQQQPPPVQREQQQAAPNPQEREATEAAAYQKSLEQNERTAQRRIDEKLAEQKLKEDNNRGAAQQLAPEPNRDQQAQQQRDQARDAQGIAATLAASSFSRNLTPDQARAEWEQRAVQKDTASSTREQATARETWDKSLSGENRSQTVEQEQSLQQKRDDRGR